MAKSLKKTVKKSSAKSSAKKVSAKKKSAKKDTIVGFKTVDIDMCSWHDSDYKYIVGKEHSVDITSFDKDNASCGVGLHFAPTKKDAIGWADGDDFILLEVQANKSDLLGKDSSKFRVSKLKVLKILERVEAHGDKWKAAVVEANDIINNLCKPSDVTPKQIEALIKEWDKLNGNRNVKPHIIDNFYEAKFVIEEAGMNMEVKYHYNGDDTGSNELDLCPKWLSSLDHYDDVWAEICNVLGSYIEMHSGLNENLDNDKKDCAPIIKLLKLGCLPLTRIGKSFVIYVPKEDLSKNIKRLY